MPSLTHDRGMFWPLGSLKRTQQTFFVLVIGIKQDLKEEKKGVILIKHCFGLSTLLFPSNRINYQFPIPTKQALNDLNELHQWPKTKDFFNHYQEKKF